MNDLAPLWLSLQLATASTLLLIVIALPLAWWLAHARRWLKVPLSALFGLPLVLPPTVLGFYLLLALGPHGPLGHTMQLFGQKPLVFTFGGLLLGSVLYSLPFVLQPMQNAFEALGTRPFEVAATLRAGPIDRFFSIALPLTRRDLLSAAIMGFAHTVGEFGVVLMIGGNIPGQTRVVSIALYDHVEALEYGAAHQLAACLLLFSFATLCLMYWLKPRAGQA
jgi:molybdate transport system permease protein